MTWECPHVVCMPVTACDLERPRWRIRDSEYFKYNKGFIIQHINKYFIFRIINIPGKFD